MRAEEFLIERALSGKSFYTKERVEIFIYQMKEGIPFKKIDGTDVVLKKDDKLIAKLEKMLPKISKLNLPPIPNDLLDINSKPVKLSSLLKTKDFGGSEKEDLKIKPSHLPSLSGTGPIASTEYDDPEVIKDILANSSFPAGELGNRIISDPVLKKSGGPIGKIVISLAKQIMAGNSAPVVNGVLTAPQISAIRDYAGEYLGILQFIQGQASFSESEEFYKFFGTNDLSNLKMHFPKSSNSRLADSIGITSADGSVFYLSSKGGPTGAAPSLDSLKIDASILRTRSKSKLEALNFLKIAREGSVIKDQPFKLLNYLYTINPTVVNSYSEGLAALLPFSDADLEYFLSLKSGKIAPSGKAKSLIKLNWLKQAGGPYGVIYMLVTKSVMDLVNNENIIPAFQSTMLEILGTTFLQIYANLDKNNRFTTSIKWPNKIRGNIQLRSKAYAGDPTKGKLGFVYS